MRATLRPNRPAESWLTWRGDALAEASTATETIINMVSSPGPFTMRLPPLLSLRASVGQPVGAVPHCSGAHRSLLQADRSNLVLTGNCVRMQPTNGCLSGWRARTVSGIERGRGPGVCWRSTAEHQPLVQAIGPVVPEFEFQRVQAEA